MYMRCLLHANKIINNTNTNEHLNGFITYEEGSLDYQELHNTTIGKTLQPLNYGIQCYLLLQDAMVLFSS